MAMEIKTIDGYDGFLALKTEWDSLLAEEDQVEIFFTHDWVNAWCEAFLGKDTLVVFAVYEQGRFIGALPLRRTTFVALRVFRLPCWHSLTNECSVGSGIVACSSDMKRVAVALLKHLASTIGMWGSVILEYVPTGTGALVALKEAAVGSGVRVVTKPWQGSFYVPVQGNFESYFSALGQGFRKSFRGKKNKLGRLGEIRLVCDQELDDVSLQRLIAVENTGWKRSSEYVMAKFPAAQVFYQRLAELLAVKSRFILVTLMVGEKTAGMAYGVISGGTLYFLKLAVNYEEDDLARLAPGQILLYEMIRFCYEQGLRGFDFYGPYYPYEEHWAPQKNGKNELMLFGQHNVIFAVKCLMGKISKSGKTAAVKEEAES